MIFRRKLNSDGVQINSNEEGKLLKKLPQRKSKTEKKKERGEKKVLTYWEQIEVLSLNYYFRLFWNEICQKTTV